MFKISRLPAETLPYADAVRAPAAAPMDIDDDLGEGTSLGGRRTVVTPGEVITSSKEYMRWVMPRPSSHPRSIAR